MRLLLPAIGPSFHSGPSKSRLIRLERSWTDLKSKKPPSNRPSQADLRNYPNCYEFDAHKLEPKNKRWRNEGVDCCNELAQST